MAFCAVSLLRHARAKGRCAGYLCCDLAAAFKAPSRAECGGFEIIK
jgi:hypothetical protein